MSDGFLRDCTAEEQFRVANAINNAIKSSYPEDVDELPGHVIKERFDICLKHAAIMRRDLGWSWSRIHDTLPSALQTVLDGEDWEPPNRSAWTASAKSGLILPPGVQ